LALVDPHAHDIAMYLIERGAKLEREIEWKGFVFAKIVENEWYDVFLLALEKGASIWHRDEGYKSLLERAVLAQSFPFVKYLLEAGCDWIEQHSLEYLATHTSPDVLDLLISHGFSFDLEECLGILSTSRLPFYPRIPLIEMQHVSRRVHLLALV
jgi:hypothetical protein